MKTIEKIRQEIERYIKHYEKLERNDFRNGELYICQQLLSFLDTLSEEPSKSLEEAAGEYEEKALEVGERNRSPYEEELNVPTPTYADAFIAGAEWQKEQMLKDAVECSLYYDGDFLAIDLNMAELGYSEWDKVRIVVLKEED